MKLVVTKSGSMFQFHKGPIKASEKRSERIICVSFQFHKGPIKANKQILTMLTTWRFNSIKVRLKQNPFGHIWQWTEFQFHKGPIKALKSSVFPRCRDLFQFHKGSIKACVS